MVIFFRVIPTTLRQSIDSLWLSFGARRDHMTLFYTLGLRLSLLPNFRSGWIQNPVCCDHFSIRRECCCGQHPPGSWEHDSRVSYGCEECNTPVRLSELFGGSYRIVVRRHWNRSGKLPLERWLAGYFPTAPHSQHSCISGEFPKQNIALLDKQDKYLEKISAKPSRNAPLRKYVYSNI